MTVPYATIATAIVVIFMAVFAGLRFTDGNSTAAALAKNAHNVQTMSVATPGYATGTASAVGGGGIHLRTGAVVVPSNSVVGKLAEPKINTQNKQASIYTVRKGDTLQGISELFDVSVNTIVWANDLQGETIHPGDTLVILPVSGVRHEVKEGETISEIADRFGVSVKKIRAYNELESVDTLAVGAILDIPGGEMPDQAADNHNDQSSRGTVQNRSVRPANPRSVSSGYYLHPLPDSRRSQGLHGYNAVDFAAPTGSAIRAAASGRVVKSVGAGWNGGYGQFIVIRHPNGTKTLYSHMSDVIVSRGQQIVQGQTIGYVGDTGHSTGPHLHFEVRGTRNPF